MPRLVITDLHVSVKDKEILKGVNLTVEEGETVALIGLNGHGKSTLLAAIMGNPNYTVTSGSVKLDGVEILDLPVNERSIAGLFFAMQAPAEIPGVNSADFYKAAMNARREKPLSLFQFYSALQNAYKDMKIPFEMSQRNLNEGFSGGEKKRNEILQMKLLDPKVGLLDEIDSGLDVDALQVVVNAINQEQAKGRGFLVISHYARLYSMIHPSRVAVMINGRIAVEGGPDLIDRIDAEGYEWLKSEYGISLERDDAPMNKVSIGVCAVKDATVGGEKK